MTSDEQLDNAADLADILHGRAIGWARQAESKGQYSTTTIPRSSFTSNPLSSRSLDGYERRLYKNILVYFTGNASYEGWAKKTVDGVRISLGAGLFENPLAATSNNLDYWNTLSPELIRMPALTPKLPPSGFFAKGDVPIIAHELMHAMDMRMSGPWAFRTAYVAGSVSAALSLENPYRGNAFEIRAYALQFAVAEVLRRRPDIIHGLGDPVFSISIVDRQMLRQEYTKQLNLLGY
jgi:hypothetical protein